MAAANSPPDIVSLAKTILDNTTIINNHLQSQNLPPFNPDDPNAPAIPPTIGSLSAESARQTVIAASSQLRTLLAGPLAPLTFDWTGMAVIRTLTLLRLPELVPLPLDTATSSAEKGASTAALACATGVPEARIKRLIRHAATRHIFCEPREGFVAHTAASAFLARASPQRDATRFVIEDLWPAAVRAADAAGRWPGSEEPAETGFAWAQGEGVGGEGGKFRGIWEVLEGDGEKARGFGAMVETEGEFVGFPLEKVEWKGKVVDVGGGRGAVAVDLARKFPGVEFVVQDAAGVVESAEAGLPRELGGRIKFMVHDLFARQPVQDADVYFMRWVLHDWSDKYAVQIIQYFISALKPGARVRLNEGLMPKSGTLPREIEAAVRDMDIAMMVQFNSQERDLDEWKALFARADERFKFVGVTTAPPGIMGIIEFEWNP